MARPVPIRIAQASLLLFTGSAIAQTAAILRTSSPSTMFWMLPASLALGGGVVFAAIHQCRASARPLAAAAFGAASIRGVVALLERGFPLLAYNTQEVLGVVLVLGCATLATWFGLSGTARRDLAGA